MAYKKEILIWQSKILKGFQKLKNRKKYWKISTSFFFVFFFYVDTFEIINEMHRAVLAFSVRSNFFFNFSIVISACSVKSSLLVYDRKAQTSTYCCFSLQFLDFPIISIFIIFSRDHYSNLYNDDPRGMKNEHDVTQGFSFEEARMKTSLSKKFSRFPK